jgi:2-keto-4-pentenoate hydratase
MRLERGRENPADVLISRTIRRWRIGRCGYARNSRLNSQQALDWVARLANARESATRIQDHDQYPDPNDAAEGYQLAMAVSDRLAWQPLGWKIAGTTEQVRQKLGIKEPIYGRTWRRFAIDSPARFEHTQLLDPLVECEFFVTLGSSLPWREQAWTYDEVVAAIGKVQAGIEVAECRFPTAHLPALPLILADGAASGRYVFGGAIDEWRGGLADVRVDLWVDGALKRSGKGQEVMGDPLLPLLWLAEQLRRLGRSLSAGEMISTGSCTGMLPVRAGQRVEARFGSCATVNIEFSKTERSAKEPSE